MTKQRLVFASLTGLAIAMTSGIAGVAPAAGHKCTPAVLDGFYVCESTNKQRTRQAYLHREAIPGRDTRGGGMLFCSRRRWRD